MSTVVKGVHARRLRPEARNPGEVAYSKAWAEENNRMGLLAHILNQDSGHFINTFLIDHREAVVAATVIQWLGSPVGQAFVADVIKDCPELKRYMQNALK